LAWPSEEGDRRSATATRTSRDKGPLRHHAARHCFGCPDWWGIGSDQRDGSADRDDASLVVGRAIGVVNVFLRIYQHRNGNPGPRVLLGKPAHTGVGERPVEA
jgi:hypothetical protein